jgi:hypothetical protein
MTVAEGFDPHRTPRDSLASASRTTTGAIDRTDQGEQRVLPGGERSAQQAAMAREARWRGKSGQSVAQKEPGGMFEALDTTTKRPAAEAEPELPL